MNMPNLSPEKKALLQQRLEAAAQKRGQDPAIPRRPNQGSAPLSFTQRQMWAIDQMMPGNPAYNLPYGYRLRGRLDPAALEEAFNEVIKRHEVLRTTFVIKDGGPQQRIHPNLTIRINITALDHLPAAQREGRLQALASQESVEPF